MDEIDQLDCKSQEVLYTLFEWPALPNSRVILIGESEGQTYSHAPLPSKYINPCDTVLNPCGTVFKTCDTVYVIGIANALDLTDRILPRLQSHTKCRPQLLHFPPFTKDQIVAILQQRLGSNSEGTRTVVDPMAVQFCARKVAAVHGDLRKALDVCR